MPWWSAPVEWPHARIEVGMLVVVGPLGGAVWSGEVCLVVGRRVGRTGAICRVVGRAGSIELPVLLLRPVPGCDA